tara:strand:- start:188 stop:964 length:777 start_codon:yes stop_codon:yes gene_type:complete
MLSPGIRHPFKAGTGESLKGDALYNTNIERTMIPTFQWETVTIIKQHLTPPGGEGDSVALGKNPFYDGKARNDYDVTHAWYEVRAVLDTDPFGGTATYDFAVNFDELLFDPDMSDKIVEKPTPTEVTDAEDPTTVHKFFAPKNNAVVRSFESSMSRGLAGAITSFSMDTAEAPWETSKLGSRAPIWVKLSVTMKVIHDIQPGIDKDGFNRAPIFNVGTPMNAVSGDARYGTQFADPKDELVKQFKKLRNAMGAGKPQE